MKYLSLFLFFLAPALAAGEASFLEIEEQVYRQPRRDLPAYKGLSTWDVLRNLIGSEDKPSHGLAVRSRRTLVDESDYREAEPKWLHPRGICASGEWQIYEASAATGLFQKGTRAPLIMRISSGDGTSLYKDPSGQGRIFGMAIKLFPGAVHQKVKTRNIVTLDQEGFERSGRKHVFHGDKKTDSVYFTNVAPARSALGKFLSSFFDRFDNPNWARPLYALASASRGGGDLSGFVTPYEIRFEAEESFAAPSGVFQDFRQELAQKQERSLKIILQSFNGKNILHQQIGRIQLNSFVVSDFCDLSLHFHHHPVEDQWSKYSDYGVVEGKKPERR